MTPVVRPGSDCTPAMLAVLRSLRAGVQPDARSWRAIEALKRRGLVAPHPGSPRWWMLTAAGEEAIA